MVLLKAQVGHTSIIFLNEMKRFFILYEAIILSWFVSFGGCSNADDIGQLESPEGSYVLSATTQEGHNNSLIILSITDSYGNLLHQTNTHVSSFHKWDIKWVNDSKILLKSSDAGPMCWVRQPDGMWKKTLPYEAESPDGTLVAHVFYNSVENQTVSIAIMRKIRYSKEELKSLNIEAESLPSGFIWHYEGVQTIPTDIVVTNLFEVLSWNRKDRIRLYAGNGVHEFVKGTNDSWRSVNNTP